MLPTFCRVTGNSRNMPKPNYFPLLPPISPVEARRICRLMGKAVPPEDHLYVPVIEYARPSKQSNCHITGLAPPEQHHYQPTTQSTIQPTQCRITAKHQINESYKYVYPVMKEPAKPLKQVLERMSSRSEIQTDQRFVYKLEENSTGLVVSAEMEAAIRRGEIESLSVSKDATSLLIRLKDGPSLTLDLQNGTDEAVKASTINALFEGAGQDQETLLKQVQIKQYKKRKISGHLSPNPSRPVSPMFEPDLPIDAKWDERIHYLTSANRSASNLLVVGANWRDIIYPNAESWDWESLKNLPDIEIPPKIQKYDIRPLDVVVGKVAPGFIQSNQVPVINEESTGFDSVPLYNEKLSPLTHDYLQKPPSDFIKAIESISSPDTPPGYKSIEHLKDVFNDVDSLLYLPFIHEVASLMPELATNSLIAGYLTKTELDGVTFTTDLTRVSNDAHVINGALVEFDGEKRFLVGRMTPAGFVPGKVVGGRFEPGVVVQNAEGASFLPGCIINNQFSAGQLIRGADETKFVTGQVVQTLLGPKFVPGRTILTSQGYKFAAGQTDTKTGKFHAGQIMQTEKGPVFVPGVTFDTPQGARFVAGQVVDQIFVPGQSVQTEDGASFVPGETLETADGPIFLPGQSYVNKHNKIKFCPGRVVQVGDDYVFVPGETMLPSAGGEQQFVAGVLNEEKFVPCKFANGVIEPAEKEEDVFTKIGRWSDGLPIDGSTFTALPRKRPDMGYMVQHEERIKFLPTEQSQDELLSGVESGANVKIVPGQLLELGDTPKFVPGKKIESAVGSIFIPGQAVRTGPNKLEQFVPGQVIDGGKGPGAEDKGPTFCPGQMVNCESGKKFVPGQVFSGKNGPRFIPGKILVSPSGVSTFIPGQVVYSCDRGSIFVPGNVVDTSKGPYFVPGRVLEQPNGSIKFVPGEIIETETGPHYVTPHETDIDLLDDESKEIVVQGFPVSPEELRLITAYPFAALHYPTRDGERPVINSRMLRQMAAAGIAVSRLTNTNLASDPLLASTLNDVIINAPKELDNDAILGADVNRQSEPTLPKAKKEKKEDPVTKTSPVKETVKETKEKSPIKAKTPEKLNIPPIDGVDSAGNSNALNSNAGNLNAANLNAANLNAERVTQVKQAEQTPKIEESKREKVEADDGNNAGNVPASVPEGTGRDSLNNLKTDDSAGADKGRANQNETANQIEVKKEAENEKVKVVETKEEGKRKTIEEPIPAKAEPVTVAAVVEPVANVQQKPTTDSNEKAVSPGDGGPKIPGSESTGTRQDKIQQLTVEQNKNQDTTQGQGANEIVKPDQQEPQSDKNKVDTSAFDANVAFVTVAPVSNDNETQPSLDVKTDSLMAETFDSANENSQEETSSNTFAICTHCGIGSLVIQSEDGTFALSRSASGLKIDQSLPVNADVLLSKVNALNGNTKSGDEASDAKNSDNSNKSFSESDAKNLTGRLAPDGQESENQKNLSESYKDYSESLMKNFANNAQLENSPDSSKDAASSSAAASGQPNDSSSKKKRTKDSKDSSKEKSDSLTLKTDIKIAGNDETEKPMRPNDMEGLNDSSKDSKDSKETNDSLTLKTDIKTAGNEDNEKPMRPNDMKGLNNSQSLQLTNGKTSPLSPVVDSSKLIEGWRYLHRATNGPQDADASPTTPPPPIEIEVEQQPPLKPRKFNRRVTSRSNSTRLHMSLELNLSEEDSLELEDESSRNSQSDVPPVITSAKDISKEVIDTLRYSRDEKMKAYYTQKILEAVGLSIGNDEKGNRSRKTSNTNASACIILKDFLQTIVPAEAAHGVLIGGIDYMVIDDEGVRYFESASGFASRRNSRYDIRQAARSRSSSQDPLEDQGPWPWADVGPRQHHRRMSIDEFRRKLHEQDNSVSLQPLSRSASSEHMKNLHINTKVHGRHSVASLPVTRRSSGYTTPSFEHSGRRSSLVDDPTYFPSPSNVSLPPAGMRKRKVGVTNEPAQLRRSLYSRSSFDMDY